MQRQSHGSCATASHGIRVPTLPKIDYLSWSVLVADAIALAGPSGFVGLIVPHLVRSNISPDHRVLLPSGFLFEGALVAICDAVGRILLSPAAIPAGAVLALIGGPYLVWAIRQRGHSEEM
jgi:iron complex transport system permease protein